MIKNPVTRVEYPSESTVEFYLGYYQDTTDLACRARKESTIEPDEEVEIEEVENEENDGIIELVKSEEQILQSNYEAPSLVVDESTSVDNVQKVNRDISRRRIESEESRVAQKETRRTSINESLASVSCLKLEAQAAPAE